MKEEVINELLNSMSKCNKCTDFKCKEKSLINIYKDCNFSSNIPSMWTDWFNRLDSKIMIIGQDWGPFNDMKMFNEQYIKNPSKSNWKYLIEQEKRNTKK